MGGAHGSSVWCDWEAGVILALLYVNSILRALPDGGDIPSRLRVKTPAHPPMLGTVTGPLVSSTQGACCSPGSVTALRVWFAVRQQIWPCLLLWDNDRAPMTGRGRRYCYSGLTSCVVLALAAASYGKHSEVQLPDAFRAFPYSLMSLSVGTPARGWQLRAKKLRASEYLIIKDTSQHAVFGHPALVLMLQRTAKQMVRNVESQPLVVGDLSSEEGGPLYGHHSHQSGRDADVGFFALNADGEPQHLERFVTYDGHGHAKDGSGLIFDDYRNWLMVLTWLKDERAGIKHVFVSTPLRRRLLEFARSRPAFAKYADDAAKFLLQPRNASRHDDHFHVRIACPDRQRGLCRDYH